MQQSHNLMKTIDMKALSIKSIIFFSLLLSNVLQAQIYKCQNSIGETNFSDEPCVKGESSTRLKNLEFNTPKRQQGKAQAAQQKKSLKTSRSQRTAQKAEKNNEAYVLLSLKTTTQLELETNSLRSTLHDEMTELPELVLSDGIIVDLLIVNKILIAHKYGKKQLHVKFIMDDGYEETKIIKKPFPTISGKAKIGRFSKSLGDIKQIEFFNSAKLRKQRAAAEKLSGKNKIKKQKQNKIVTAAAEQSAVIELDLSHQLEATQSTDNKKIKQGKSLKKSKMSNKVQVVLVDGRKIRLIKSSLNSSREGRKSGAADFILNDHESIPFAQIKAIKIRPTQDKNSLVVAVSLKNGEIKMENMSKPFTRISATSDADVFDRSLLNIKSISF